MAYLAMHHHHASSCRIMLRHVSPCFIQPLHASSCLIMPYHAPACLAMPQPYPHMPRLNPLSIMSCSLTRPYPLCIIPIAADPPYHSPALHHVVEPNRPKQHRWHQCHINPAYTTLSHQSSPIAHKTPTTAHPTAYLVQHMHTAPYQVTQPTLDSS